MLDHNLRVEFDSLDGENRYLICNKSKYSWIVVKAIEVGKMFLLDVMAYNNQALIVIVIYVTNIWHHHFGHMNPNYLITLQKKKMVHGIPFPSSPPTICST